MIFAVDIFCYVAAAMLSCFISLPLRYTLSALRFFLLLCALDSDATPCYAC